MRVKVIYYGFLKVLAGAEEAQVDLSVASASVRDVVARVAEMLGVAPHQLDCAAAAVDDELVERSRPLREGDVVMLLPPVSGG